MMKKYILNKFIEYFSFKKPDKYSKKNQVYLFKVNETKVFKSGLSVTTCLIKLISNGKLIIL